MTSEDREAIIQGVIAGIRDLVSQVYMSAHEVAEYLRVSESTIWAWKKSGKLPHKKIGGRTIFVQADVNQAIQGSAKLGGGRVPARKGKE